VTVSSANSIGGSTTSDDVLSADLQHILLHTADLWEELRGQRLFITGGTGFVGSWLLESFIGACDVLGIGAEVVVLTRRPEAFRSSAPRIACHPCVQLIEGDVQTFKFPETPCKYVIHAASDVGAGATPSDELAMLDASLAGARRVLEYARWSRTRKLLFVSSGAVYGRQAPSISRVPEEYGGAPTLREPGSVYGEAKRVGEMMCVLEGARSGFEAKIARGFAFVGPYLPIDARFAIGNFVRDALGGGPVRVKGNGTPRRSYLYAADLAIWLWTILFRGTSARAYNVGSTVDVSVADVANVVASSVTPNAQVVIEQKRDPVLAPERYVPDTRRAHEELGLREQIDLRESVIRTLAWHRRVAAVRTA
jgi:nucleoside-diphosphate-sugar epimerase